MRVLLLAGGDSEEREISLRSGANIAQALRQLGHTITEADPADPAFDLAALVGSTDIVFPILHGAGGEDGVLQRELEQLQARFLGSGSKASETAFDKVAFKKLMHERNIPIPEGEVVDVQGFTQSRLATQPFVLKPIDGGSSIDTFIVRDVAALPSKLKPTLTQRGTMLLEELVEGHELTVSVLGDQAMPVVLIVPPEGEEFDYENKYNGKSREIAQPKEVSQDVQKRAQNLALKTHHAVDCRHLSRTDIMARPNGELTVLEINTIPGLTAESLLPKAAEAAGLDMKALTGRLVELAVLQ